MMTSTAADHVSADRAWHHLDTARTVTALPHRAAEGCAEPPTDEDSAPATSPSGVAPSGRPTWKTTTKSWGTKRSSEQPRPMPLEKRFDMLGMVRPAQQEALPEAATSRAHHINMRLSLQPA